jgi:uncharacterized protein YyaL (SSP411 family)
MPTVSNALARREGKPILLSIGYGMAALTLGRLGHLLGEASYLDAAERTLRCFQSSLVSQPASRPRCRPC